MIVRDYKEVRQDDVDAEGASGVKIRWIFSKKDGAPHFAMREFELAPGGQTPFHDHDWEHEVFILEGEGVVASAEGEHELRPGTAVLVAPGEDHNFKNTGTGPLRFLCLVPHGAK
jgi:quercetin dioxygenase-like cupin family protein